MQSVRGTATQLQPTGSPSRTRKIRNQGGQVVSLNCPQAQVYSMPQSCLWKCLPLLMVGGGGVGSQNCIRKTGGSGNAPGLGELPQPWPPARRRSIWVLMQTSASLLSIFFIFFQIQMEGAAAAQAQGRNRQRCKASVCSKLNWLSF